MASNLVLSKLATSQLVTITLERRRDVDAAKLHLEEVERELFARELTGKQAGVNPDESLSIVAASADGFKIGELAAENEEQARALAGENFAELFKKTVTFEPKSGFADRADALLSAKAKAGLLALVQVPTKGRAAYVRYK